MKCIDLTCLKLVCLDPCLSQQQPSGSKTSTVLSIKCQQHINTNMGVPDPTTALLGHAVAMQKVREASKCTAEGKGVGEAATAVPGKDQNVKKDKNNSGHKEQTDKAGKDKKDKGHNHGSGKKEKKDKDHNDDKDKDHKHGSIKKEKKDKSHKDKTATAGNDDKDKDGKDNKEKKQKKDRGEKDATPKAVPAETRGDATPLCTKLFPDDDTPGAAAAGKPSPLHKRPAASESVTAPRKNIRTCEDKAATPDPATTQPGSSGSTNRPTDGATGANLAETSDSTPATSTEGTGTAHEPMTADDQALFTALFSEEEQDASHTAGVGASSAAGGPPESAPGAEGAAGSELHPRLLSYKISPELKAKVQAASAPSELEKGERGKLYNALQRIVDNHSDHVPPAVLAKYQEDKEHGCLFGFVKQWVLDPSFGSITICERHVLMAEKYTNQEWAYYTQMDLNIKFHAWEYEEGKQHVEHLMKIAKKTIKHPDDPKNPAMKMYKLLKSSVEGASKRFQQSSGMDMTAQLSNTKAAGDAFQAMAKKRAKMLKIGGDDDDEKEEKKKKAKTATIKTENGEAIPVVPKQTKKKTKSLVTQSHEEAHAKHLELKKLIASLEKSQVPAHHKDPCMISCTDLSGKLKTYMDELDNCEINNMEDEKVQKVVDKHSETMRIVTEEINWTNSLLVGRSGGEKAKDKKTKGA